MSRLVRGDVRPHNLVTQSGIPTPEGDILLPYYHVMLFKYSHFLYWIFFFINLWIYEKNTFEFPSLWESLGRFLLLMSSTIMLSETCS